MTKAFIVLKKKDDWFSDVATNYSQLNFDFSVTSRLTSDNFEYIITQDLNNINLSNYEYSIVVQAGTIFGFSYYERKLKKVIEDSSAAKIDFNNNPTVAIYKTHGSGQETLDINYKFPFIDPQSPETFAQTHVNVSEILNINSNMSYVIHNELPVFENVSDEPVDWALTVGSGFFINQVLHRFGFTDDANIIHIDVSRLGMQARKYTIENWDGLDYEKWMDHLYTKFPSMSLFNNGKFTSKESNTQKILDHMKSQFKDQWMDHWNIYKNLNHTYTNINIGDVHAVKNLLGVRKHRCGVIWWDGALKRLPANLSKTSDDSWTLAKQFTQALCDFDSQLFCFGGDHCGMQFNGTSANQVVQLIKEYNSRDRLWKNI